MITRKAEDTRPWWWPFGGKAPDLPGWSANRPCKAEITTSAGTHPCGERGEHYTHRCIDPKCRFRWCS